GDIGRARRRDVLAAIKDSPGARFEELGQQVENRCLARAVRTDQRVDRAALHLEIDPLDRGKAAKLLGQTVRFEDQIRQDRYPPMEEDANRSCFQSGANLMPELRSDKDLRPRPRSPAARRLL